MGLGKCRTFPVSLEPAAGIQHFQWEMDLVEGVPARGMR